jgi:competence/damage-inducible protein CinA-like protein
VSEPGQRQRGDRPRVSGVPLSRGESVRAGIVVTGTEVLSGIIRDANGPWLSEALRTRGVVVSHIIVVGDRPADLRSALDFLSGADLIVTSGGLGPTADDLTADVVAEWAGAPLEHDPALEERIWAVVSRLRRRMPRGGAGDERSSAVEEALRAGARKQALVPVGAAVLEPVGTAPGLLVGSSPLVAVLPGPPRELQTMWEAAVSTPPLRELLASAGTLEQRILRFFPLPEPQIAATLRELDGDALPLEITTCLRRGELEVATVFAPSDAAAYAALEQGLRERHGSVLFSDDGATIDEVIVRLLDGRTVATAESCTGGLMAGRLTDLAGSSAYVQGGLVVYSNEAKTALAGVPAVLIAAHGAVSPEVATALSRAARERLEADVGIGITGIAGPGGGTPEKPVGTVCISISSATDAEERTVRLPGGRADVRDRTTTVALHMLRALLLRA